MNHLILVSFNESEEFGLKNCEDFHFRLRRSHFEWKFYNQISFLFFNHSTHYLAKGQWIQ